MKKTENHHVPALQENEKNQNKPKSSHILLNQDSKNNEISSAQSLQNPISPPNSIIQNSTKTSTNSSINNSLTNPTTNQQTNDETTIQAEILKVVFYNEENNYTVLRLKQKKDIFTAVGTMLSPIPGESIEVVGEWINNEKFGQQFKVSSYRSVLPSTNEGIEKFLSSGLIAGIGPVTARKIVKTFGEDTFDIIENQIEKLTQISGINAHKLQTIKQTWDENKEIRQIIIFLQQYNVSPTLATKIFKQYGNNTIKIVQENPYRLAYDIFGIGFLTADKIAAKLGFDFNSIQRCEAGILYVLTQLSEDGHVFYFADELIKKAIEILKVDYQILLSAIINLDFESKIYCINCDTLSFVGQIASEDLINNHNICIYLANFFVAEFAIAKILKNIYNAKRKIKLNNINESIIQVQDELLITLAQKQIEAIKVASASKILTITGGPGTGKTTIIRAIINIFKKFTTNILLTAPTGRAAKRMCEATGHPAKTIHRLLEATKTQFLRNENNPLETDLIIIDESSMIDTILMYSLLKAIPKEAVIIFVGDINQLPSVGPGCVLKDIINSQQFPVVELNEIFRQAQQSKIIVNSHRIISGEFPICHDGDKTDFYFINEEEVTNVTRKIIKVVKDNIPNRFNFDSLNDIQVLTPMNKGLAGSITLNEELQNTLNPSTYELISGYKKFRINDKVMQIKNNYDKDVFNGDIGIITDLDKDEKTMLVNIDGRDVLYRAFELDELMLAYAISIHKSQGSEYPAVVIPIVTQHYIMLARNLIYTGITRGKKLVVLIGSRKAMHMAINNNKTMDRYTMLCEMLKTAC